MWLLGSLFLNQTFEMSYFFRSLPIRTISPDLYEQFSVSVSHRASKLWSYLHFAADKNEYRWKIHNKFSPVHHDPHFRTHLSDRREERERDAFSLSFRTGSITLFPNSHVSAWSFLDIMTTRTSRASTYTYTI